MFNSPHPRRTLDHASTLEPDPADAAALLHLSHHEMVFLLGYRLADDATQSAVDALLLDTPSSDAAP